MSLLYIWVQTFFLKQHLGMQACFLLMMGGKFQIGYYWNCNVDFLRSAMCTFFFVHPKKAKGAPFTFRFPSCLSLSFLDPPPKIPGLINNDRLVYKNSSGSLLGKKAGRQKISIPSDPLKARNCCNKQKPGTKLWARRRTFFTSHFFDLCSAGRLPNSINSSIQVNLSGFFLNTCYIM